MKKKYLSGALASLLLMSGLAAISSPAQAANLPTVKILSPTMNPANDTFAADGLQQWYAAGGHSYFYYVGAGSTITIFQFLLKTLRLAPGFINSHSS